MAAKQPRPNLLAIENAADIPCHDGIRPQSRAIVQVCDLVTSEDKPVCPYDWNFDVHAKITRLRRGASGLSALL